MTTDTTEPQAGAEKPTSWRYYLQQKVIVIFGLGFSSGLPFPLVYSTLSAWLEDAGIERSTISTFAWLGFAYSLKFCWAPLIDSLRLPVLGKLLGHRRSWLLLAQIAIALSLVVMSSTNPTEDIAVFAIVALAVAFLSATQDIIIDAYRIESAPDDMQGVLAAAYQYGYRISLLISMAGALYLADYASWELTYRVMAGAMLLGIITTLLCPEPAVLRTLTYEGENFVDKLDSWFRHAIVEPFEDFSRRFGPYLFVILAFVSLYRISDYVLGILANPFYLAIGFSKSEVATVAKVYGLWVTLFGVGLGGWAVVRYGVARCLIIATVLIASTNLFFAAMSQVGAELWMLALTISADNIAQGFGGTVLIAYLSSLTNRDFTATQYALLSSFMALLPKFTAGYSGDVQESLGWFGFFLYAAALGVPAIILATFVARRHDALVGEKPTASAVNPE
ncbi:MAG: AmpG family muropeptide MFS transporter [Pseudomonadota bacterium]